MYMEAMAQLDAAMSVHCLPLKAEFVMRRVLGHREHGKPVPTGQVVVEVGCREEKGEVR
jgi:hypothetical protein